MREGGCVASTEAQENELINTLYEKNKQNINPRHGEDRDGRAVRFHFISRTFLSVC